METVEAHLGKMEVELGQWSAELDELDARADAAGTDAKIDYRGRLDAVREKYEVAAARFAELKRAGKDSWGTLSAGIERAWSEVEDAFRKLPGRRG